MVSRNMPTMLSLGLSGIVASSFNRSEFTPGPLPGPPSHDAAPAKGERRPSSVGPSGPVRSSGQDRLDVFGTVHFDT